MKKHLKNLQKASFQLHLINAALVLLFSGITDLYGQTPLDEEIGINDQPYISEEYGKWNTRSLYTYSVAPERIWFGKVVREDSFGTGTLISKDLVVTAAHVIGPEILGKSYGSENGLVPSEKVEFILGLENGFYLEKVNVTKIWWGRAWSKGDPSELLKHDWAILKIDRPIGDVYGEMPLLSGGPLPNFGWHPMFKIAGYAPFSSKSTDRLTGEMCGVDIDHGESKYGLIELNGFIDSGDSGGPIYYHDYENRFGNGKDYCFLGGINVATGNVAEGSIRGVNFAIPLKQFLPTYLRLSNNEGYFGPPKDLRRLISSGKAKWKKID